MDQRSVEPVRLVIWDLDETFWKGTLTEGGITFSPENRDVVIALAERGIISTICSKNDLEPVGDAPAGYSGGTKNVHRKPVDQSSPSDTNPVMFFCNGLPPKQGMDWFSGLDQILDK